MRVYERVYSRHSNETSEDRQKPSPQLERNKSDDLKPHFAVFGIAGFVAFFGAVSNSGVIGTYLGGTAALAIEPVTIIAALLVGLLAQQYPKFLGWALVVGIAIGFYRLQVSEHNRQLFGLSRNGPRQMTVFVCQFVAFFLEVYAVNLVRKLIDRRSRSDG